MSKSEVKEQPFLRNVTETEQNLSPDYVTVTAVATSLFKNPDRVMLITSHKMSGLNRNSDNRWYRWENQSIQFVKRNSGGKLVTGHRSMKVWLGHLNYFNLSCNEEWCTAFEETFGKPFSFAAVHPLAPHYGLDGGAVATGFSGSLKEAGLREQVAKLFGKTRVRKDLLRAVAGSHPNAIMLAREFRGLVPIDWIVKFLVDNPRAYSFETNYDPSRFTPYMGGLRTALYQMQPKVYRDLLNSGPLHSDAWYGISDLIGGPIRRGTAGIPADGFRTFVELHDEVFARARYQRTIAPQIAEEIPATKLWKALHEAPIGALTIRMPSKTSDLWEWGSEMRNCIGSYASTVTNARRSRELGGIYEGAKLIGNFEINGGRLVQLLGKCNSPLPVGVRTSVEQTFQQHKIVVPNTYWGSSG